VNRGSRGSRGRSANFSPAAAKNSPRAEPSDGPPGLWPGRPTRSRASVDMSTLKTRRTKPLPRLRIGSSTRSALAIFPTRMSSPQLADDFSLNSTRAAWPLSDDASRPFGFTPWARSGDLRPAPAGSVAQMGRFFSGRASLRASRPHRLPWPVAARSQPRQSEHGPAEMVDPNVIPPSPQSNRRSP
jgi:hypothetical protein